MCGLGWNLCLYYNCQDVAGSQCFLYKTIHYFIAISSVEEPLKFIWWAVLIIRSKGMAVHQWARKAKQRKELAAQHNSKQSGEVCVCVCTRARARARACVWARGCGWVRGIKGSEDIPDPLWQGLRCFSKRQFIYAPDMADSPRELHWM
jgi:hypothetical protein